MQEEWKVIEKHPKYLCSSNGRIKNAETGRIYTGSIQNGYVRFCLCEGGIPFSLNGHRTVAELFIPNPDNKPFVNHKDGNKQNNSVDNLEWCTAKENSRHAFDVLGIKPSHRKQVLCVETGEVFASCCDAAKAYKTADNVINRCCNGKRLTALGRHWEFVESSIL